jgi:hypothetical protein
MKTESPLFRSIGVLLALLMFVALPSSVLATPCEPCCPCTPYCEFYYGTGGWQTNTLELETEYPTDAWIFYTKTLNAANNNNPCHVNGTPCTNVGYTTYKVPNGAHIGLPQGITYIRMMAWTSGWGNSEIAECDQQNPPS